VLVLALFPVTASANYAHVVQPGETLTSVAAVDGLSIEAIASANGISPEAQLISGQTLWIPPRTTANAALGAAAATSGTTEQVAATSSQVATTASRTSTAGDPDEDGDTDTDAATTTSSKTTAQPSTTAETSTAASRTSAVSGGPIPTPERVSSTEIAGVADANAVPAALAEAIAWQESGWNNDVVSSIGAVGVMQIVPTTWTWIDRYLTPANPLGTASASENLRAGMLLLHQLLGLTGGNEQLAVAGYYQGLGSVRRFGMYPSTRHYVADVMALAARFGA
jgi:soluble lytic murein transglycosylase-like protein